MEGLAQKADRMIIGSLDKSQLQVSDGVVYAVFKIGRNTLSNIVFRDLSVLVLIQDKLLPKMKLTGSTISQIKKKSDRYSIREEYFDVKEFSLL